MPPRIVIIATFQFDQVQFLMGMTHQMRRRNWEGLAGASENSSLWNSSFDV